MTPTLPVTDIDDAVLLCETAGFDVERHDDGFAFVPLDDQSVFDLNLVADLNPETNSDGYIIANDVDDWHDRLLSAGLIVSPVEDHPWAPRRSVTTHQQARG